MCEISNFVNDLCFLVKDYAYNAMSKNALNAYFTGFLRVTIISISDLIKKARGGRSQQEFAHELGVSQSMLCRYENGEANPKTEVIERCMRVMHIVELEQALSADELAEKIRTRLSSEDKAPLRIALSKLIDGLVAG